MNRHPTRRALLALVAAAAAVPAASAWAQGAGSGARRTVVEVWKDPNCGCCNDWVKHLQDNGFAVTVHETGNTVIRARLGIDPKYGSCHTAVVAGYALEGHVPAREIRRLLAEKPAARGLAVPGMPIGSPGMDAEAYGGRKDPYDVLLLARDGSSRVYQRYQGSKS